MKRPSLITLPVLAAALAGCQLGPSGVPRVPPFNLTATPEPAPVFPTGVQSARLGEPARFIGLTLTPVMVAEDSRCPAGAQCVWAGLTRVSTAVNTATGADLRVLTLGTPLTIGDRNVTLVDLCPTPNVQRAPIPARPVAVYAVSVAGQPAPAAEPCPAPAPEKPQRRLYWPLRR